MFHVARISPKPKKEIAKLLQFQKILEQFFFSFWFWVSFFFLNKDFSDLNAGVQMRL